MKASLEMIKNTNAGSSGKAESTGNIKSSDTVLTHFLNSKVYLTHLLLDSVK